MSEAMAAVEMLRTSTLRSLAKEFGVKPSFFSPGKGSLYLKRETLLQRLRERVQTGTHHESNLATLAAKYKSREEGAAINTNGSNSATEAASGGMGVESDVKEEFGGDAVEKSADGSLMAALEREIARVAQQVSTNAVDESKVRAIVEDALLNRKAARLEVVIADRPPVDVGLTHKAFAKLVKMLAAGVNVWLAGPAGSGKTTGVEQAAKALGLPFYFNGAIDTEYKLMGFVDAQGRIVNTAFRKAFTEGGVYLFDEADASLAPALLAFNAALANGQADFPGSDKPTPKHADFKCCAAGNTWGLGATAEYVGRNKLDAAFLDRFVQLSWDYDEELEAALCPEPKWLAKVQTLRAKAIERGLKVVISPRASINGAKLIAAGLTMDEVLEATIGSKLKSQDREALGVK